MTSHTKRVFSPARWAVVLALLLFPALGATTASAQSAAVKVAQTSETFTLSNDVIVATVSKRTGDLVSLPYKGTETLTPDAGGHSAAYWSRHDRRQGRDQPCDHRPRTLELRR